MTSERHSVDDLLSMATSNPSSVATETKTNPIESQLQESDIKSDHVEHDEYEVNNNENETTPIEYQSSSDNNDTDTTDEYGNTVAKSKMYSEEEVQRMIRERLARSKTRDQQQPTQQQVQDAANNFNYDENSSETWQQQLDSFVRQTVKNISQEATDRQRQMQDQAIAQEFETKFQSGMTKYPDFVQTIQNKPITDAMMNGIRGLDNPAAFLYAAAKMQAGELDRISKIQDPYQQVAEMGRLHERMKQKRTMSSNAAKPLKPGNSDIVDNTPYKKSIEDRIAEHGKERVRR